MTSQSVFIGTPAMDRRVHVDYAEALLLTQAAVRRAGIGFRAHFVVQDSLVMQARNQILANFHASDATDLIFIDSDIGWEPDDFKRLISHDVPFAAGVYRRKSEKVSFTVQFADRKAVQRDRATGLVEAIRVGAGFLRLRRDAVERMIAAYPNLRHAPPPRLAHEGDRYALFDTSLQDGEFVGEDFTFCDRWRAIGGKIWVDPSISLRHIGTVAHAGTLAESLNNAAEGEKARGRP